jgi:hypothetical protein
MQYMYKRYNIVASVARLCMYVLSLHSLTALLLSRVKKTLTRNFQKKLIVRRPGDRFALNSWQLFNSTFSRPFPVYGTTK